MVKFTVHTKGLDALPGKLGRACDKAEHTLALQVMADTRPYVPFLEGSLDRRTKVKGNEIIYPGPYARYLYYGKVMETLDGKGPNHFVDKNGNEVIRFPFGSKLRATDRNLVFTKQHHPDAQAYWFEASKAQNVEKWERASGRAIDREFK